MFPNSPPPAVATLHSPQQSLNARLITRERLTVFARTFAILALVAVIFTIIAWLSLKGAANAQATADQACAMRAM